MLHYPKHLTIRPLIGLSAAVVQSTNPSLNKLTGHITDDTHGTLTLFDGLLHRQIPKVTSTFKLVLPGGETARIDGKSLLGHPAERLRRAKKLRW
ncbi:MAG: ribonuclease P protein component 1 [Candidatus Hermodarchaeia archaeon]|jgi:RNase P/RNase MRP subunit p29